MVRYAAISPDGTEIAALSNKNQFVIYSPSGAPARTTVRPSSGTVYRSGALTFRFSDIEGLRLIAWTDRGIHYSLVSESGGRGAESCIICHGRSGERRLIDDLKPHE